METKSKLEKILSKGKKTILGIMLASGLSLSSQAQQPVINSINLINPSTGAVTNQGYYAQTNPGVPTEKRIYYNGKHFLSVLNEGGIFAIRPHPGDDVDGWGGTIYLQPFLNGNTTLKYTQAPSFNVVTNNGVPMMHVAATGQVSRSTSQTYGNWNAALDFKFDSTNKKINATGTYDINLPGQLSAITADLNYYKLANNLLRDVPLVDGTTNSTGDMTYLNFVGDAFPGGNFVTNSWNFAISGSSYPQDYNTQLMVEAVGDYNLVDTPRQGYSAISPAYKPTIKINLQTKNPSARIMLGLGYDSAKSKDFTADNVGVNGYINSSTTVTNYSFNVNLESSVLSNDCYSSEANITCTDSNSPSYNAIYWTSSLTNQFERVGSMKGTGRNFAGKVKVNNASGFIKVVREL